MRGERIYVSMERNMQCGIGHCGHCQLGPDARLPRRARLPLERARARGWRSGSCDGRAAQADARRVEVLLLRRLPAEPARLRGRAARARRPRCEIAYFLEATSATVEGPYDVSLVEGSITTAARRRAHPGGAPQLARADHDRRLRDRGRHPGAAQLRRRRGVHRDRLRLAGLHLDAAHLDADQRARAGRLRAATAARSTSTSCSR